MDVRLEHPFTMIVSGPTSCGKTHWTMRILHHAKTMIQPPPETITFCFGEYQEVFHDLKNVDFVEGLPDINNFDRSKRNLVVIDDMMSEMDGSVTNLFTKGSHHRNVSVVLIVQNFFSKNKEMRSISLNSHYIAFFKNPRDKTQVSHLAKQMYPGNTRFVQEAFADATKEPFGYLFVDLKQSTPEHMRLRTHVFPDETQFVYLPKKLK